MQVEWDVKKVTDIASKIRNAVVGGPFGSNLVARDYVETGVPVIRGQNMTGRWIGGNFAYVTQEKARSLEANLARPGDIVFTQRGTLGQVALVPEKPFERYLVSQSQMKLTVNRDNAEPLFFYYQFLSPAQQEYIGQQAIQVGVPHTNLGILRETPVIVPPVIEQRAIAHILGTLDDKVELNGRMNETLKAVARAVFTSWFVDFDPVRAKSSGEPPESICRRLGLTPDLLTLFPSRLVDSELGEIPEGWSVRGLDIVAALETTSTSPTAQPDEVFEHYSIPAFDALTMPTYEFGSEIKSNKYIVSPLAVLVSKLNPETPRVWLPEVKTPRAVCSTEFMQFVPRSRKGRAHLYLMMCSDRMQAEILKRVTGSTGSRQRAQPSQIAALSVLVPTEVLLESFDGFAAPLLDLVAQNREQSQVLAAIRDTLLPKLISGELRIPLEGAA